MEMELGTIIEKERHYTEKLTELASIDIDVEVDKRLADAKRQLAETIRSEIHADTLKCQHYLELLAELKADYIESHKVEEEKEEPIIEDEIPETLIEEPLSEEII